MLLPVGSLAAQSGQAVAGAHDVQAGFETARLIPAGASVTILDSAIVRQSAARTLADLLSGRVPGLNVTYANGASGAAPKVVMLGTVGNVAPGEPVLYIDGILHRNDDYWLGPTTEGSAPSVAWSLPVDEIAEVRIVAGAPGGALLEVGASRGAVFVRTKRPVPGTSRVQAFVEGIPAWEGTQFRSNFGMLGTTPTGTTTNCTLDLQLSGACTAVAPLRWNLMDEFRPFQRAVGTRAGMSGSATTGRLSYRAAAIHQAGPGLLPRDQLDRTDLSLSVQVVPLARLGLGVDVRYAGLRGRVPDLTAGFPIPLSQVLGPERTDSLAEAYRLEGARYDSLYATYLVDWVTLGLTGAWSPTPWAALTARLGVEDYRRSNERDLLIGAGTTSETDWGLQSRTYSAGGELRLVRELPRGWELEASTALHWSHVNHDERMREVVESEGEFPSSMSLYWIRPEIGAGVLAFTPRLSFGPGRSVGAGVRWERLAAFEDTFGYGPLKFADVSWALGPQEESGRVGWMDALRVHAAYGEGRDQRSYFAPFAQIDFQIASGPPVPLDADLTRRSEFGAKARLLGTLNVGLSHWRQDITKGLLWSPLPAEFGYVVGLTSPVTWRAKGYDLRLGLPELVLASTTWRSEFYLSTVETELVRTGVAPFSEPSLGNLVYYYPGERAGTVFAQRYTYDDANGDGVLVASEVIRDADFSIIGSTAPRRLAGFSVSADLGRRVSVGFVLDGKFDHVKLEMLEFLQCNRSDCEASYDPDASLAAQAAAMVARSSFTSTGYIRDASFVRLRELSVAIVLPGMFAPPGAGRARLRLSGHQLATWTRYPGHDPEVSQWRGAVDTGVAYHQHPVVPSLTIRLDLDR